MKRSKVIKLAISATILVAVVIALTMAPASKNRPHADPSKAAQDELADHPRIAHGKPGQGAASTNLSDAITCAEGLKNNLTKLLQSDQPRDQKFEEARRLLGELAALEGSAKTVEWLKEQVGDGLDFSLMVTGIFSGSNEPLEVIFKQVDQLPYGAKEVVECYLFQKMFASDDPWAELTRALESGDPAARAEGLLLALKLELTGAASIAESMDEMKQVMNGLSGEAQAEFRKAFLTGLSAVSAKDAWLEMKEIRAAGVDLQPWEQALIDKTAGSLRLMGAREALEFLLVEGGRPVDLAKPVSMWGNRNSVELGRWIDENMGGLSPSQQDGVRLGLGEVEVNRKDFAAAESQLETITDSVAKAELGRILWEGQRDAIREKVEKDPAGTVDEIVSGTPQFGDYWIEEAMMTWIAKDPGNAETWYQKNWETLPPEKAQYVAAAYAKDALAKGDPATATQWANLIQDQKTKTRITASISEAAATTKP